MFVSIVKRGSLLFSPLDKDKEKNSEEKVVCKKAVSLRGMPLAEAILMACSIRIASLFLPATANSLNHALFYIIALLIIHPVY